MSFSQLHKWITYLISGLGLVALSLGPNLGMPILTAMFVAYAGSYFAEGDFIRKPGWATGWTVAVVGLLAFQLMRAISDGPSLELALEFAAFLQISRLFNRRTAADYQQIAVLSFLHLIAATVLSTQVTYALVFIGFVIATPWMLAVSHLRREIEGNYPVEGPHDARGREAIRRVLASKRVVGGRFLLGTVALSVPLFAMTVMIFLTLPRVGQGFLTFNAQRGTPVTGFGNQVELGGFGLIREDPTVVLRVKPRPSDAAWLETHALRMRGTAFDHYDGRRWTRSKASDRQLRRGRNGSYRIERYPRDNDVQLQVFLDHLDETVVFLPVGTVALDVEPRVVRAERIPRQLRYAPGLDVRYVDADGTGLVYVAHVDRQGARAPINPRYEDALEPFLQVPDGHERVADFARELTADAGDPLKKALALQERLRAMTYTLQQPEVAEGQLPLDVFLFEARRGHCEYFSSAMAVMLRTLGIPARNVTGFVGGQYNPYGEYYALRQGDAHSWVEAYIPEVGWMTFDPTPVAAASMGPKQNLWADIQAFVDAVRLRWATSVLGYDLSMQVGMMRKLTRYIAGSAGTAQDARVPEWRKPWRDARIAVRRVGKGIAVAVVLVLLSLLVRRLRGGGKRASRLESDAAQAVKLYQDLERALARRGAPRPPDRTPIEHVEQLREQGFDGIDDVEVVTHGYMAARYGARALSGEQLGKLRGAVRRVVQAGR